MNIEIRSPLTQGPTKHIKDIDVSDIVENYKIQFNIDIKKYFYDIIIETIQVFECIETGYQFYTPKNISGDSEFYERLQRFEWYYMLWKWEHEEQQS